MLKLVIRWGLCAGAAVLSLVQTERVPSVVEAQSGSQHAYFDALVGRRDHWRSYSLRSPAQLAAPKDGGYANSNSARLWVTYDPANDSNPERQDAAKVVIPAFAMTSTVLASSIDSSTTTLQLVGMSSNFVVGRTVSIDNELMVITVRDLTNSRITVTRGQHSSAVSPHLAGASLGLSSNSLANQVRLPLGTEDGHTYLFTWDTYWTSSYVNSGLSNHKAFQFSSGRDGIWLEPRTRYDGGSSCCENSPFNESTDVATVDIRSYQNTGGSSSWSATENLLGPGVTGKEPLQPKAGSFNIRPNKWTRFWVRIEQRANDYDYIDYWVADEARGPVQIYRRLPVSVPVIDGLSRVQKFWLEFNTSSYHYRGRRQDLVAYVRNFVALMDSGDPAPLLIRPGPGAAPTVSEAPAPPTGLRVLTTQ